MIEKLNSTYLRTYFQVQLNSIRGGVDMRVYLFNDWILMRSLSLKKVGRKEGLWFDCNWWWDLKLEALLRWAAVKWSYFLLTCPPFFWFARKSQSFTAMSHVPFHLNKLNTYTRIHIVSQWLQIRWVHELYIAKLELHISR